ncbi:MAG: histidinol-phosphatase [Clostridia bacterium]|nr:histidinol-phosphatase [Clostridia bacterium]
MITEDFHIHTTFSDGRNSAEEMVLAAIGKGMTRMGFSDHASTPGGESYCMKREDITAYRKTIAALREKYRGQIEILCGIEQDLYSDVPTDGYDYVIGSVHSLKKGDRYYDVDHTEALLRELVDSFYGGDFIAMAEDYFANVARLADMKPHIIGHIDLITKFNEGDRLFNTRDPRYLAAAYRAVDALIPTGAAFEINTGAISRRRRTAPYPSDEIREYIRARGGKLILCSDAHNAESIGYGFDAWQDYVTDSN